MATASEIVAKTAKYLLNTDRLNAIINGPASGPESIVLLDNGSVKTLGRILLEMGMPVDAVEWDEDTAYLAGQWVVFEGHTYYALKDVPPGIMPPNEEYWYDLGEGVGNPSDLAISAYASVQEAKNLIDQVNTLVAEISDIANQAASDAQDSLSGIAAEAATRAAEITNEITARTQAILALQPPYDNTKSYVLDDVVFYNGKVYQAKGSTTGHLPTDTTYWTKIGDYGSLAKGLVSQALILTTQDSRITSAEGVNTSQASSITSLTTRMTSAEGVNTSQATAISGLDTRLTSAEGVNTSQATAITNLTSSVASKADASALSSLTTRVTAAEGTITGLSSSVISLSASLNGTTEGIKAAFKNNSIGEWTVVGNMPDLTYNTNAASLGGYVARIGNNSGNDGMTARFNTALAFDPNKLYRVRMRYRRVAGDGTIYLGLAGMNADQNAYVNTANVESSSLAGSHYLVTGDAPTYAVWQVAEKYIKGRTTGSWANNAGTIDDPIQVAAGVMYLLPMFIANYNQLAGVQEIDYITIEDADAYGLATQGATAITTLDARVTAAEGVNTSQASAITSLTADVASKADASALNALTTRVTAAEGVNTSQASAITSLTADVASKADASALTALTTRVTTAEGTISSQSDNITSLQNAMFDSGSQNLIFNPSFDIGSGTVADGWYASSSAGVTMTPSLVASPLDSSGKAQQVIVSGVTNSLIAEIRSAAGYFAATEPGRDHTYSVWVKGPVNLVGRLVLVFRSSDNSQSQAYSTSPTAFTGSWQRLSIVGLAPSFTYNAQLYCRVQAPGTSTASGTVQWDRAQLEAGDIATGWRDNVLAASSAVSALDSRVTSAEGVNTSQASSITSLSSTVSGHTASISSISTVQSTQAGQITALKATNSVLLNVDGRITGTINNNTGATSDFTVLADKFSIVSTGSGARTEYSSGNWRCYDSAGTLRVRMGVW